MKTVEELARQAGAGLEQWSTNPPKPAMWWFKPEGSLERFAALVRAQALEEAAVICESFSDMSIGSGDYALAIRRAAAIRVVAREPSS